MSSHGAGCTEGDLRTLKRTCPADRQMDKDALGSEFELKMQNPKSGLQGHLKSTREGLRGRGSVSHWPGRQGARLRPAWWGWAEEGAISQLISAPFLCSLVYTFRIVEGKDSIPIKPINYWLRLRPRWLGDRRPFSRTPGPRRWCWLRPSPLGASTSLCSPQPLHQMSHMTNQVTPYTYPR